jgi:uncharacterized protein (TIGR03382 family)
MLTRLLCAVMVVSSPVLATTYTLDPTMNFAQVLTSLQPGDEAVFTAGTYVLTGRLGLTLAGTAAQPITLRGQPGAIVRRNDATQNLIDFQVATFVTISGLEFVGGSRGLRFLSGNDVTVRDCSVHDTDSSAITTNDVGQTYARFHFVHNELHHTSSTGEGLYLGCNNDGCRLQDSEVTANWVHHTNGPNVTPGFGTAIQLKEGSSNVTIADNVVHDTGAPCVLVDSTAGHGPVNVVERNLLFNCGDHGLQASQDVIIRNNVVLEVAVDGISVMPHQAGVPQNVTVVNNTVVVPTGNALSVRNPAGTIVVANNALYAVSGAALFANGTTSNLQVSGNAGLGGASGLTATITAGTLAGDFRSANAAGTLPMDLGLKAGSVLIGAGVAALEPAVDFELVARTTADVGAYAAGHAPAWALVAGFKVVPITSSPDAGVVADAGVSTDGGTGQDSGVSADAGQRADGGALADAGTGPLPVGGGCGCSEVSPATLVLAVLLVLATRRRR